jgi:uncharacterized protein (DUF305 family)
MARYGAVFDLRRIAFFLLPLLLAGGPRAMAGDSPATTGYRAAMDHMQHGMMHPFTNDADRDFVSGMIPHHQGAIDMAKVELQYGHDPVLKRLAQNILAAQEQEIALMRRWQAQHQP